MSYSVKALFDCVPIPKAGRNTMSKLELHTPRDLFRVEQLLDIGVVGDDTDLKIDANRTAQKLLQRI
jgi:hypothetical protein